MKIAKYISDFVFRRKNSVLVDGSTPFVPDWYECRLPFADTIFYNICELLTDLCNDVTFVRSGGDALLFSVFTRFFQDEGKHILNLLFDKGFVVIGSDAGGMWLMRSDEYMKETLQGGRVVVKSLRPDVSTYVMMSDTYRTRQKSDKALLSPFLSFLDNVLNASNTVSARLGSLVIMSPNTPSNAPTTATMSDAQKEELEKQTQEDYGGLAKQRQIMFLTRSVNAQVINLAGLDQRTEQKARMAILAICDRIKVPANQVAIIDANSSKSLSNGSELREGDFNKYQSFERLLNDTFVRMAKDMGLQVDYNVYNKPQRQQTAII